MFNPFRDRSPERSAEFFLKELESGGCAPHDSICVEAFKKHHVSNWRLKNRDDDQGSIELYYGVTEYVSTNPYYTESGEGTVDLVRKDGSWVVTNYSSVF